MLGLALEGGGAKGAYEIGAYRALTELGYRFDVICGVSIGAINAALLAQGDCERAAEFWETMSNDDLFSEKDRGFLEVINRQVNLNTLSALKANIKTALENGGIDTSRIRAFLEQNIDPRRLLDSPVDYGMIAVAFPELQPLIAYKKEMTPETVIDHVLASASFPGFQPTVIGDKKYLDEAKFFLDKRGYTERKDEYSQAHKPILEQNEAVGHAVRAAYMYSGIADVAALTGDQEYIDAIDRIWENVVTKKLYITGGIGATGSGEAFGKNYELPNMSAYCETCAAIGNVYWNYRLFLLKGDAKYYDVFERTLYNGVLSGISLDGGAFFYPNPLESIGQHQRSPWFGCACCPSNACRFIPSVPGYIYAVKDKEVYVNLFVANESTLEVAGKKVGLKQSTSYPWNGDIRVAVTPRGISDFAMKIRIPGWVQGKVVPSDLYRYADGKKLGYTVKVNGKPAESTLEKGYFTIQRKWKKGDIVDIHFDMEPRIVKANYKVEADRGRVSVERGPVVYCAEWPDNDFSVRGILMNQTPEFTVENRSDLLYGIELLKTQAQTLEFDKEGRLEAKEVTLSLIPYYAWAHRGAGEMTVWLPIDLNATRPAMPPTIASESEVSASHRSSAISAVNDRLQPQNPEDRSMPYYHWWPKKNTTEWIVYDFKGEQTVSSSTVYWFDDGPWGGCRIPEAWKVYYKNEAGTWVPVKNTADYPIQKDAPCTVEFEPVKTAAVKLEVQLPEDNAAGIFEWEVK